MIWRRLLVGSDSSIADLHHTLQIAFGWSDSHLHRFHIHGRALRDEITAARRPITAAGPP
jgi:hypothetical protein